GALARDDGDVETFLLVVALLQRNVPGGMAAERAEVERERDRSCLRVSLSGQSNQQQRNHRQRTQHVALLANPDDSWLCGPRPACRHCVPASAPPQARHWTRPASAGTIAMN